MKTKIFITCFVVLFLVSSGCQGESQNGEAPPVAVSDQLALLPINTNFLMYANFEAMRKTPLGQDIFAELAAKSEEDWERDHDTRVFLEATGIDPAKDIREMWIAVATNQVDQEELGGAIIRGNFDQEKIINYLKREERHRLHDLSYKEYTVYIIDQNTDDEIAFAFLNSETVAAGKQAWLRSVLDLTKDGGDSVLKNPLMAEHIEAIPHREHFWGIVNLHDLDRKWTEEFKKRGGPFKGAESLENMKTFVFHTYLDQKADINLRGIFTNDEEAELFTDMLKGFKAMAKMMASNDVEAIDMLNEIKIKSKGNTVQVSAYIGKEFVDKVEQKRKSFSGREFDML